MQARIEIYCPPMAVRHKAFGLSLTDELPATGALFTPGPCKSDFNITFPPTLVRVQPHSVKSWVVDPCVAVGEGKSVKVVSNLPAERCEIKIDLSGGLDIFMQVYTIQAPTTVTLPDGRVGTGVVTYPDCKSHRKSKGVWEVDAVVAVGVIEFPDVV